jgi:diacylglycerol kinase family enzyme
MAPHADPFDGKLTVVFGYRSTRLGMFALLPKTMRPGSGSYVESPGIQEFTTSWLKVHLENPTPAHIDGEVFTTSIIDLEYHIFTGGLKIFLP